MLDSHEVYKDIARVPEKYRLGTDGQTIKEGDICKVTVGHRSILLSLRGDVNNPECQSIQVDERTRRALSVSIGDQADFQFQRVGWVGQYLWAWRASDPAYRIGARFGLLSLLLGFIGIVLGIVDIVREIVAVCSN